MLGSLLCWPFDHFIALSMCCFLPEDSEVWESSQRAKPYYSCWKRIKQKIKFQKKTASEKFSKIIKKKEWLTKRASYNITLKHNAVGRVENTSKVSPLVFSFLKPKRSCISICSVLKLCSKFISSHRKYTN